MSLTDEKKQAAPYKTVDFHANAKDFQCVMLAALGWTSKAIAEYTGLSINQVTYRISKSEQGRKMGDSTQRAAYRSGQGGIAHTVVGMFTDRSKPNPVQSQVVKTLDLRGLYEPQSRGVLRDDPSLPKR